MIGGQIPRSSSSSSLASPSERELAGEFLPVYQVPVYSTDEVATVVGSSLDDLRDFPAEARRQAGFELYAVQRALEPSDWKAMNAVGSGAREIRIHVLGEWRVLYVAKFGDAVFVLHAFQKKSRKTRREDVELARQRYQQIEDK